MKLALYSISLAGGFYDGPGLSLPEIIQQVRGWGYEGLEISGKRPHGSPLDLDAGRRKEIVGTARQAGVEIPAVAAYTDFSSPVEEHRENELLMTRELIRLAADLGAPIVRVFAAWAGITRRNGRWTYDQVRTTIAGQQHYYDRYPGTTQLERWTFVRDCLAEAARIDEAPDGPNGVPVPRKLTRAGKLANYPAFIRAIKEQGYDGYLAYELCHPCLIGHCYFGLDE